MQWAMPRSLAALFRFQEKSYGRQKLTISVSLSAASTRGQKFQGQVSR